MLAAGGLLVLLAMGVAMSGLFSGDEADPPPDAGEDAGAAGGDPGADDATRLTSLAEMVFGPDDDDTAQTAEDDDWLDIDPADDPTDGSEDLAGRTEDGPPRPVAAEPPPDLDLDPALEDDGETLFEIDIAGDGTAPGDMPRVDDFVAGVDRLILDFDGAPEDAPGISFDTESDPGSTMVLANGLPVTLLVGVEGIAPQDIEIRMSGHGGDPAMPLEGGTESDLPDGRAALNEVLAPGGEDAITGGVGDDTLAGSGGNDAIFGNEGDDSLAGGAGADELHGDEGRDTLSGGDGRDLLSGGDGPDSLAGGAGGDLLFGGAGDDLLEGGAGDDGLQGGFGADTLSGGPGDDRLDGTFASYGPEFGPHDEDAPDLLDGGDGDDSLLVGAGDLALGGDGADSFTAGPYIETAQIAGHVADFDPVQDTIEVVFDPELTPDPVITVEDFEDGSGAAILFDGQVILTVTGAQGLDPAAVELREIALAGHPA